MRKLSLRERILLGILNFAMYVAAMFGMFWWIGRQLP